MKPQRRTPRIRPMYSLLLVLGLTVLGSSCTLSENNQYVVTTGTSFYVTIKGPSSAALSLIGVTCNYEPGCVHDKVRAAVSIDGNGAAQWYEAVDFHSDELANVMRAVVNNGGSVNAGGPCIQMWHSFFGGSAGFDYLPRDNGDCPQ